MRIEIYSDAGDQLVVRKVVEPASHDWRDWEDGGRGAVMAGHEAAYDAWETLMYEACKETK